MKEILKFSVCLLTFILASGPPNNANALSLTYENALLDKVGLQWLSPTMSVGKSYDYITDQLSSSDSDYFGLRLATKGELRSLFSSYDMYEYDSYFGTPEIDEIYNDFGTTRISFVSNGGTFKKVYGLLAEDLDPFTSFYGGISSGINASGEHLSMIGVDKTISRFIEHPSLGSWLVRDAAPVPEPTTALLFGAGLIGIVVYKRKKKN